MMRLKSKLKLLSKTKQELAERLYAILKSDAFVYGTLMCLKTDEDVEIVNMCIDDNPEITSSELIILSMTIEEERGNGLTPHEIIHIANEACLWKNR